MPHAGGVYECNQHILEIMEKTFKCNSCGHELPLNYNMRTPGFCYMCDHNVTVEELLSPTPTYDLQSGLLAPQLNATDKVRALSWKQPFASLMLHGKIETRLWNTKYRGLVLICASAKGYTNKQILDISGTRNYGIMHKTYIDDVCWGDWKDFWRDEHLLGTAIAIGELIDSRPMRPEDAEACFVEYKPDLFCHVYANVKDIKPIPWKGKQGWSTLTKDIINQIEIL